MPEATPLLARNQVPTPDTWQLDSLYTDPSAWEQDFEKFKTLFPKYGDFRGKLHEGVDRVAALLKFDGEVDRIAERLGTYAFLRTAEDQTNSDSQSLVERYQNAATRAGEAASFIRPELLALPDDQLQQYLASDELASYRLILERIVRYKPYTLSDREEEILAMQGEMSGAAGTIFRQLLDSDLKFGKVRDDKGREIELTNATFMQLLHSPDRQVRKQAFHQYYEQFQSHENTLAAALKSSVQKDVYYARVRGYDSALQQALFPDNMPQTVYDSLIEAVRRRLPTLYRYYDIRRRRMQLDTIHHYDTYVPILSDLDSHRSWDQAVSTIMSALTPLGTEYCTVLESGLTTSRWCDRYPNKGKQSGAFSCGSYDGDPYILMNYKPDVLDDMFTLAHEAGHSMHSYFSAKHQPFEYYNYTIFVAEVASTFNEQLLSHHLMAHSANDRERAYLVNRDIDAIRGTIIRQTMFAEFERDIHAMAEAGEPLTCQSLKDTYRKLLEAYFGPDFTLDAELSLEGMRIPHFYRAFYVYKYATGLSAAIALSQRVLKGGDQELSDYLGFLQGGCSKDPLDLLRGAGVDMERPEPVETALAQFETLVGELDRLLD